jgi:hypothetical protein
MSLLNKFAVLSMQHYNILLAKAKAKDVLSMLAGYHEHCKGKNNILKLSNVAATQNM